MTGRFLLRIEHGWLCEARRLPSPNFNTRPKGVAISLLVIHNISLPPGEYCNGCVEAFFTNCLDHEAHPYFGEIRGLEVSAHCFVSRLGKITQFVSFDDRAWHAGRSSFQGVMECNDYSIGIELEGTDTEPYTEAQYDALVSLTNAIQHAYPAITYDRICGHSDIAPQRKTDPGPAFEWPRYRAMLATA